MTRYQPVLDWIASQQQRMLDRVVKWSNINSSSHNLAGLERMAEAVVAEMRSLPGDIRQHVLKPMRSIDRRGQEIQTALGPAISLRPGRAGAVRVLLGIHFDTVYPPDDPFQSAQPVGNGRLGGPGVADAKGGLAVLLTSVEAIERSDFSGKIGWEILLNPDEEIGSPGSASLLAEAAGRNDIGLLFEPALADGSLVDRWRGSGNFAIVIHGRAAHAGRDFAQGRSAILSASRLTLALHELNQRLPGVTVNVGAIDGGGPANVVPDLAICRVNVRTTETTDQAVVAQELHRLIEEINQGDGTHAELHGDFTSPPKIPDARGQRLLDAILDTGKQLDLNLTVKPSGGACDGNKLSAAGLPNVDSLGVRGGNIHSPNEFMVVQSLTERAQLTALLLMRLASGEIPPAGLTS